MSFNYRFEPPTNSELDDLTTFEYECDHNCNDCFWSCEVYPNENDTCEYDCQEESTGLCKHNCTNCLGYEMTGECNHGCFDCIHFDGSNCINIKSNYYDCTGDVYGANCHVWNNKFEKE